MKNTQKLILTMNCVLLFLTLNAQTAYKQSNNSRQLQENFNKRINFKNTATVRFINPDTKQYLAPSSIKVIEKTSVQLFNNITKGSESASTDKSGLTPDKAITFTIHNGIVNFQIREHCDYIIKVNDHELQDSENSINWIELLQNDEIVIQLQAKKVLTLNGLIRSDLSKFQKEKVKVNCKDVNSGESYMIAPDFDGRFSLKFNYGGHYLLTFSSEKSSELTFGLQLNTGNHIFKPVNLKSGNFEVFLEESIEINSNTTTTLVDKQLVHFISNHFDYSSHLLTETCKKDLDSMAAVLKSNSKLRLAIKVYTDARGHKDYNQRLTKEIADKMALYISSKGIHMSRLIPSGMGSENPVNDCNNNQHCTESQHLANRRAEIQFLDI